MKKLFALMFVAGALCMVSCGPSAEEKAKMEADLQRTADSLIKAAEESMSTTMDSAATAMPDSAATAPATEGGH